MYQKQSVTSEESEDVAAAGNSKLMEKAKNTQIEAVKI